MMKFLVVLLVVAIGLWSLAKRLRGPRQPPAAPPSPQPPAPGTLPAAMVRCAHCGLHLPAADAVAGAAADGSPLHYCSPAHQRLGPARSDSPP